MLGSRLHPGFGLYVVFEIGKAGVGTHINSQNVLLDSAQWVIDGYGDLPSTSILVRQRNNVSSVSLHGEDNGPKLPQGFG